MSSDASISSTPLSGALVLVVGPSGAGKDTVIDGAKAALKATAMADRFSFPKRMIDRPQHASEDFISVDAASFSPENAPQHYALYWSAHGSSYGIPAAIGTHLERGQIVVVNVSRTIVAKARAAFDRLVVVAITCPPEIRAERLALRGRETGRQISARTTRKVDNFDETTADHVIDNTGPPTEAIAALVQILIDEAGG